MITPRLALECKHCGYRAAEDSVLEAQLLHFQVEHDTDQIEFNLVAVCTCGTTMGHVNTAPDPYPACVRDIFECPACSTVGKIRRKR